MYISYYVIVMTSCLSPEAYGRLKGTVSPKIIGIKNFIRDVLKNSEKTPEGKFLKKSDEKFRAKTQAKKKPPRF